MMKKFLHNERGAMTIVLLMMLGSLFVIMMGIAGVKLLQASQKASETNEAYNYLIVMEEMGIAITRARSLGRDLDCGAIATCPGGTVAQIWATATPSTMCPDNTFRNQYSMCVPATDADAVAEASDFCVTIDGFRYCLNAGIAPFFTGLTRTDVGDESATPGLRPPANVAVAGAPQEQTNGAVPVPRNNAESWSPTAVAWAFDNQMHTTDCSAGTGASEYWRGCNTCADPRVECWQIGMCRPSTTGVPIACVPGGMARQGVMIYFENNRRQ